MICCSKMSTGGFYGMICAVTDPATDRRVDLDWIRIGAFLALILYHVGMYYVSWDWHVKSPFASRALEPLMFLTNPWRLALLFLVSGAATAFMLRRLDAEGLARSRSWRLLVPLAFGMLVVVPPQSYFEVVEKAGYAGSFLEFYGRYLAADRTFCRGDDCLVVPTWNHLWFVMYLWFYTMVVALVLRLGPGLRGRLEARVQTVLSGWGLLVWPWLVLAAWRVLLVGRFGSTLAFVDDWHNHAFFFTVFSIGFLAARSASVWQEMERLRWIAAALAVASYAFIAWYFVALPFGQAPVESVRLSQRVVYALNVWTAIVAICGFAHRHIRRDGPVRRYLTDAIFPFYIVHQTAIIAFAVWLRPLGLAPAVEGPMLLALTAAACAATYELVRRVAPLRPLFGLKRAPQ